MFLTTQYASLRSTYFTAESNYSPLSTYHLVLTTQCLSLSSRYFSTQTTSRPTKVRRRTRLLVVLESGSAQRANVEAHQVAALAAERGLHRTIVDAAR